MISLKHIPFRENIGIKILAVFFSLFLWLYVMMEKEYITTFSLPIELVNGSGNLLPSKPFPARANVRIEGTGRQLVGIKLFSNSKVMVDVFNARAGRRNVILGNSDVFLGDMKVRVIAIDDPQTMEITFDNVRRKKVPVANRATFITREGYLQVGKPSLYPDMVSISGPEGNVALIDTVYTAEKTIKNLESDTNAVVPLVQPNAFNVSCSLKIIRMRVQVQKLVQRELKDIPVNLINVPAGTKVDLDTSMISLTIVGGEDVVNNFTPNDLNVVVDYRKFTADSLTGESPAIVKFKAVECVNLIPQKFRLKTVPQRANGLPRSSP